MFNMQISNSCFSSIGQTVLQKPGDSLGIYLTLDQFDLLENQVWNAGLTHQGCSLSQPAQPA